MALLLGAGQFRGRCIRLPPREACLYAIGTRPLTFPSVALVLAPEGLVGTAALARLTTLLIYKNSTCEESRSLSETLIEIIDSNTYEAVTYISYPCKQACMSAVRSDKELCKPVLPSLVSGRR